MIGKNLRDSSEKMMLEAYIQSKTFTDKGYAKVSKPTIFIEKLIQTNIFLFLKMV